MLWEWSPSNVKENDGFCSDILDESNLLDIDECFDASSELSDVECATLYCISGYVTFKEKLEVADITCEQIGADPCSDFASLISGGKLCHLTEELLDLSFYLYSYFKLHTHKCCTRKVKFAFQLTYEHRGYTFPSIGNIINRYVNCFFNPFMPEEFSKMK